MKSTYFNVGSDYGIKKEVEMLFPWLRTREWRFFRCITTSNLGIAEEPINGWSINGLKRFKFYISSNIYYIY